MIDIPKITGKPRKAGDNISQFNGSEVLLKMIKQHSTLSIAFFTDKDDDWLIHIVWYKTKTGEISHESMIIRPDVEQWERSCEREGFIIEQRYNDE